MSYDENLAGRIRERFEELKSVEEKEMMGVFSNAIALRSCSIKLKPCT